MTASTSSESLLWGTAIRYKDYHIPLKELDEMRMKIDNLADDCFLALHENGISVDSFITNLKETSTSSYTDLRIRAFAESVLLKPEWLDYEQIQQGQQVFLKHYASAALGLLYSSLIGGFAAPKIVKVLDATAYMTKNKDATWKRLNETMEMVVDCIDKDDSLVIGNRGFNSVLKVRFLHSRVRLNILGTMRRPKNQSGSKSDGTSEEGMGTCPFHQGFIASSKVFDDRDNEGTDVESAECTRSDSTHSVGGHASADKDKEVKPTDLTSKTSVTKLDVPSMDGSKCPAKLESKSRNDGKWDSEYYGQPINQEDMAVTLLSFSVNVLETIERTTLKGSLTRSDQEAYIHLWRYIGYLIGVHEDLNPCSGLERAGGFMESAVIHLLHPDQRSVELARHLLHSVADRPPLYFSYGMHSETARSILGKELADGLGIERNLIGSIYAYLMLKATTLISLYSLPRLTPGSARIERVRRILRLQVNKTAIALKLLEQKKATCAASYSSTAMFTGFLFVAIVAVITLISGSFNNTSSA
jgi:ER-bound oxygenase mpaB/B'/Rubber oxygenase, catalytic domain